MPDWLQITVAVAMFVVGLRLSAFFSGSETGFYRLSLPRLGIDAQAGDQRAARLLWFAHRPSQFVATTLVGNNIANYLITMAVANGAVLIAGPGSERIEVLATLAVSPVIFLFGELLPKSVYYRAPLARMRPQLGWLRLFFWLATPASLPLVWMTRVVERLSGVKSPVPELLPGRGRFLQMISHGHREGLLTQTQTAMATGVLALAGESVVDSMIPSDRVLGLSEDASREEVLELARAYRVPVVALHSGPPRNDGESDAATAPHWCSYVQVAELRLQADSVALPHHPLPRLPAHTSKLVAFSLLHEQGAVLGAVIDGEGRVLGTISSRGLIEQLYRPELRGRDPVVD